jgi:coenzyme PQQ precursor peptide PqqA
VDEHYNAYQPRLYLGQGNAIGAYVGQCLHSRHRPDELVVRSLEEERTMKVWTKPAVREQEVGLEVTSYMPAEIDIV